METVQFRTKIKNGIIEVPKKYQGKFKNSVRVVLISGEKNGKTTNIIEELMAHPLRIKGFKPLTREEAHARK